MSAPCIFAEDQNTGDFHDYNGTSEMLIVDDSKEINRTADGLVVDDFSFLNITDYKLQTDGIVFGDVLNLPPILAYKIKYIVSGYDEDSFKVVHAGFVDVHLFTLKKYELRMKIVIISPIVLFL